MKRAFTLVELLVVTAVSAILLTIIAIPVIQGFNLTRAGQAFADAQNRARNLMAEMTQEIGNATSVRDLNDEGGQVAIYVPSDPDRNGVINGYLPIVLEHSKIDLLVPSEGDPTLGPNGGLLNPDSLIDPFGDPNDRNNWREDPTLKTPKGQVNLPVTQGLKMVRYFVGLNRPIAPDPNLGNALGNARYNNPYDGLLMRRVGGQDNLFVLRRAEVELRQFAGGAWQVNPLLDTNNDGRLSKTELDDPFFFVITAAEEGNPALRNAKIQRIQQWEARSRIVTEFSRYDMIMPIIDRRTRLVQYDGVVPRVQSLVSFTPTRMTNEPVQAQVAVRSGEEVPNSAKIGPDTFTTTIGGWSAAHVHYWPANLNDASRPAGLADPSALWQPWNNALGELELREKPAGPRDGDSIFYTEGATTYEVFDVEAYLRSRETANGGVNAANIFAYPFSYAIAQSTSVVDWTAQANVRASFVPFYPEARTGKLVASFDITEVGNGTVTPPAGRDNRPAALTGDPVHPDLDPAATTVNATSWQLPIASPSNPTSQANQRFNILWRSWDQLAPSIEKAQFCDRFVDLRFVPNFDGALSPLHPTQGFMRTQIVPGSEVIFAPDQVRGDNYGKLVRYTRVPTPNEVGPNQYYINYVHQPLPTNWTVLGLTPPADEFDWRAYNPTDFTTAVIAARYRPGYVKFNSDPGRPLPAGNIFVTYRFQMTEPRDTVAVDFDSGEKVNMVLTIRNFPAVTQTVATQDVTLTGQARVRNFSR